MDSHLRNLLREYLQTKDPATFLNLISHTNRSGLAAMQELELQLCRVDLQELEQVLTKQLGEGRIQDRGEAGPPYRCGFTFQKMLPIYHQLVVDWEITFRVVYETLVGTPQRVAIREKPLIMIYCKYTPELVGMAYRAVQKSFPHYAVEISDSYPQRHEALNGCHTCGRFPKAMGSDYCKFHDKLRKDIENRTTPPGPSRNPATLVKYLTAQEFLDEMNYQDTTGKHRAIQPHWQIVADHAVKKASDPTRPFVLVQDLPLDILSLEHAPEDRDLIADYAGRSTEFPPIYVSLTDYQLSQDPAAKPKVKNGNHRVVAANRRGDAIIDAIMTQETWKNIQTLLGLRRRNPDEQYRDAERKLRADDTFENRVNFLRMRLRVGEISADRVEAAAEIGSPEAQAIYTPSGVVGMDWAISILADHVPLKPLMEQAALHALEGFTDNDAALRYIRKTFINPKYDFSARMGPTDARAERFVHATTEEIRNQLALQARSPGTTLTDWGVYDRARQLATAVKDVWSLSNVVVPEHQRTRASDIAYRIIALCHGGHDQAESNWQRDFIIDCLLRGTS